MKARRVIVVAAVAALSLVIVGGVAFASGVVGPTGWMSWMHRGVYGATQRTPGATQRTPGATQRTPGAYCPMGGGAYGPGGMMGGYRGGQASQATPAVGVTQVSIQNFAFQPAVIQVPKGATVTWTNQDSAPHMVTFRSGMQGSGALQRGQTFSYTFNTPGTYVYYCGAHPYMSGTVIVTP